LRVSNFAKLWLVQDLQSVLVDDADNQELTILVQLPISFEVPEREEACHACCRQPYR